MNFNRLDIILDLPRKIKYGFHLTILEFQAYLRQRRSKGFAYAILTPKWVKEAKARLALVRKTRGW